MAYSYDPHPHPLTGGRKHDSFLQPSSHDAYGSNTRRARSTSRLDPNLSSPTLTRQKSMDDRERRPYFSKQSAPTPNYHRPRSPARHDIPYPTFSKRAARTLLRRDTWPPPPSVEDEKSDVRRDGRAGLKHVHTDEVCMPGTIDQNPIFIEVEDPVRSANTARPGTEEKATTTFGPNTSRPRSDREGRTRTSRPDLRLDIEEPNLYTRRQPSPYAYTKPTSASASSSANRTATEFLASPEPINLQHTGWHANCKTHNGERRAGNSSGSSDDRLTDESDIEPAQVSALRERQRKPRVSFNNEPALQNPRPQPRRAQTDYASLADRRPGPGVVGGRLKSALKTSISAETSDDEASSRSSREFARPVNIQIPRSAPSSDDDRANASRRKLRAPAGVTESHSPQHFRAESIYSSRPSMHEFASAGARAESPFVSTSPGISYNSDRMQSHSTSTRPNRPAVDRYDFAKDKSPRSSQEISSAPVRDNVSNLSSRSESYAGRSRHSSFQIPNERRFREPSSAASSQPSTPLPYPVDDPMIRMPNHEHYIDSPTTPRNLPFEGTPRSSGDATAGARRPTMSSRTGTADSVESATRMPRFEPAESVPARLAPCPRQEFSRHYSDWLTLRGDDSFDLCPSCFDNIIKPTRFQSEFIVGPTRGKNIRTRCDFSSPWIRLAWLLTLKRRAQSLELIYALTTISRVDKPCAEARETLGSVYGLKDQGGQTIPHFVICSCDVKYIEALFPSLIGKFSRLPQAVATYGSRICTLHPKSEMFATYLDLFANIEDETRQQGSGTPANIEKLIQVAKSQAKEKSGCPKDYRSFDSLWHFISYVPEFTVCASCYNEVIYPSVKAGSDLAVQFNSSLMPQPPGVASKGTSCQVYSARMRQVWERAVRYGGNEGLNYLQRKVRKRRDNMEELRQEQKDIERRYDRVKRAGGPGAEKEKERLLRELKRVAVEWAEWE